MDSITLVVVKTIRFYLFAFCAAAVCSDCTELCGQKSRPNIVLIMIDDLGKEWLSCYGADDIRTPNIDALAEEGMRLNHVYCMPQCTPTRLTLLTGQYPFRHGWVNHWDVPRWGGGCSFDPNVNPCFVKQLQASGYRTACAGKWQIDDFRQEPAAMHDAGFDEYCMWTGYEGGNPPSGNRYWDPYLFTDGESKTYDGAFGPDIFNDFLIDFVSQHRDTPFFIYYPMALTHGPLVHTPSEKDATGKMEKHKAMVRYTDELTGRLIDALDQNGVRDRTIVIWTTDNGTSRGITGHINGQPIAGGKAKTTENGICVPFIINGPTIVPSGVVSDALIDFTDLYPTLCELAGAVVPPETELDGKSFLDLMTGKSADSARDWIMSMGGGNQARLTDQGVENQYWFRDRVFRDKRYKIYFDSDRQIEKLVDLHNDPSEQTDIRSPDNGPAIQALIAKFQAALDRMPRRDSDPRYNPLPYRPWYLEPSEKSEVWKIGYPN